MTRRILFGLIITTTLIFAAANFATEEHRIGGLTLAFGITWIIMETYRSRSFASIFFAYFLGLSIVGSLNHLSTVIILIGLSTALGAWDLSRFRARTTDAESGSIEPELARAHLWKLAATVGAGFILALLPLLVTIPMTFVGLAAVMVATVIILRSAMQYVRRED